MKTIQMKFQETRIEETYKDMILGGSKFRKLQLSPCQMNSLGAQGSPCQFLLTP